MSKPLAPEVVAPPAYGTFHGLAVAGVCGLVGMALASTAPMPMPMPMPMPSVAETCSAAPVVVAHPRAAELSLVFSAGGDAYVQLAALGEDDALPVHGTATLVGGAEGDWAHAAVAPIAVAALPAALRGWAGREVLVDGTCRARVTGFAVVARLTGETGYAGVDDEAWSATSVLAAGARVIAATLDDCTGTVARDATLPPVVTLARSQDLVLIAAARAALIASTLGHDATAQWREAGMTGSWHGGGDGAATFEGHVLHHPLTRERFVSIHAAVPFACGGPDVNAWGLYRVGRDGAITKVVERALGHAAITSFLDVEGDGTIELVAEPMFDDAVIESADGTERARLALPFYGCAC